MIRSTTLTLKYARKGKQERVCEILDEYKRVAQFFVDFLWEKYAVGEKIPTLFTKSITSKADTWLSARMLQACAKQAGGIVRGCRRKHEKRLFILAKLEKEGMVRKARKIAAIIRKNPISKPVLDEVEAELDARFVDMESHRKTLFDGWLTLSSIGRKRKIAIPLKFHKHINELREQGKMLKGIRLGRKSVSISFELEKTQKKEGKTVGVDVGMNRAFTCSDGTDPGESCNGHTMRSVCERVARRRRGSKGHERACRHRKNMIGYFKNRLDWSNIARIRIEKIRHLRTGRRRTRYLDSFVYHDFFGSLKSTAERRGVLVEEVNPAYTSQRCSCCGWTRKRNRKGRRFECDACGHAADADLNASLNISLDLRPIGAGERLKRPNLAGFYWRGRCDSGQEPVVPVVRKLPNSCFS
jgi:IS605 OrfB family transposase